MPILSSNYHWILSLKILLISTGLLSMALFLKLSVPLLADFVFSEIPSIWTSFLSWLTPPYLYLLINCIIISIVASSKLQSNLENDPIPETPAPPPVTKISSDYAVCGSSDILNGYSSYNANQNVVTKVSDLEIDDSNEVYGRIEESRVSEMEKKGENDSMIAMKGGDESSVLSSITNTLPRKDSIGVLFSNKEEKPPVSSRFGQRKFVKSSPEGKPLGVSKPKRQDTLENTWRKITEGRSMPLTRHLRKSDTWESHGRKAPTMVVEDPATPPSKVMKKSETFKEGRGGGSPGGSGRMKREASPSQDELNRRVEAFIKKFNDEMRLQRQESLKQYQEMVGRGGAQSF
ncbi:uncharacterized protein LOC101210213 [Cucumis sativus]|uniref:Fiber expressed protein n=1 Tax=Cucumis sativus TaxID=3659 RepID=A0A0A0L2K5_CUCSA|nr:uncharacterized protein LOC101210213 [Cucumis sativus]KGN56210.1 hypothetical protein Csa_010126 [Cucumis sativus]